MVFPQSIWFSETQTGNTTAGIICTCGCCVNRDQRSGCKIKTFITVIVHCLIAATLLQNCLQSIQNLLIEFRENSFRSIFQNSYCSLEHKRWPQGLKIDIFLLLHTQLKSNNSSQCCVHAGQNNMHSAFFPRPKGVNR